MEWLRKLLGKREGGPDVDDAPKVEPRGTVSSEEYHIADPRDIVEEGGVAMAGPAGAPQEDTSPAERRAEQRDDG
jgi:hypothetical protein